MDYKGSLIMYVNVGALPPNKAEALVERNKTQMSEWINICEHAGYYVMFVPIRDQPTHVDKITF